MFEETYISNLKSHIILPAHATSRWSRLEEAIKSQKWSRPGTQR